MIPAEFNYEVADSVDHALSLLAGYGPEAKLLAGGHSLIPMMKLRFARPSAAGAVTQTEAMAPSHSTRSWAATIPNSPTASVISPAAP